MMHRDSLIVMALLILLTISIVQTYQLAGIRNSLTGGTAYGEGQGTVEQLVNDSLGDGMDSRSQPSMPTGSTAGDLT